MSTDPTSRACPPGLASAAMAYVEAIIDSRHKNQLARAARGLEEAALTYSRVNNENSKTLKQFEAFKAVSSSRAIPVFMCVKCEHIYQGRVSECDCTVGEPAKFHRGTAYFK